jgi:hypothetical protein
MSIERIVFAGVAVATIVFGVCSVVWPAWVVLRSVDEGEKRPPTLGEIWFIRLVGLFALFVGVNGLYAIVTGMPGADGPPLP